MPKDRKFDYYNVVKAVQEKHAKKRTKPTISVGTNMKKTSEAPEDFVVMPDWWKESYGCLGIPFRKIVQIAGVSDSGKTTCALEAMKRAQEQGYGVVYLETEGKTTRGDLEKWGIDPDGVMIDATIISEKAWDSTFDMIDAFFETYPNDKLLFVFDSYGNTISMRDEEIRFSENSIQPGHAAKINKAGVGKLAGRMEKYDIAALIVNYTYSNIGGVGSTVAGGQGLFLYCSLIIATTRFKFLEKQVKGEKIREGIIAKWVTVKNHICKGGEDNEGLNLPKEIRIKVTNKGIERVSA